MFKKNTILNKKCKIKVWLLLGTAMTLCLFFNLKAQQLPLYSQYSFNAFLLNPAVAGAEGYTAINLTSREQWLGIEDAPRTYALSLQTRIMKNSATNAPVRKKYRLRS